MKAAVCLSLAFVMMMAQIHTQDGPTRSEVVDGDPLGTEEKVDEAGVADSEQAKTAPSQGGSAQDVYYYRKGEKVAIKVNPDKNYVLCDHRTSKDDLVESLKSSSAVVRQFKETKPLTGLNLIRKESRVRPNWAIIDHLDPKADLLKQPAIAKKLLYKAPFMVLQNGKEVGLSHLFYVKLKNASDRGRLEELSRKHKATILGNNKLMPLWYTLACSKESSGNALDLANRFFESGHFSVAEPDFLVDFQLRSVSP